MFLILRRIAFIQRSCLSGSLAIHGSHDHVDGTEDGHDVGNLVAFEDVRKDLQIVAVCSTDLEAPWCDVVVPLDEDTDLALA